MKLFEPTKKRTEDIYKTPINDVYFIKKVFYPDNRGTIARVADFDQLESISEFFPWGFKVRQINHSISKKNVARGFHLENCDKMVTVTKGTTYNVLVDTRPESETFKIKFAMKMGHGENEGALYIREGVANSYLSLTEDTHYLYFLSKTYDEIDPESRTAIDLFDPELNIEWPIDKEKIILSDRDKKSVSLREYLTTNGK